MGYTNFLGDPEQLFHMTRQEMAKRIGVPEAALRSQSRVIRKTLLIKRLNPQFCTHQLNEKNPLVWIVRTNGFDIDLRDLTRDDQEPIYRGAKSLTCITMNPATS